MTGRKAKAARQEIIFTGFGGQGIILAGRILGQAAVVGDHRSAHWSRHMDPRHAAGHAAPRLLLLTRLFIILT